MTVECDTNLGNLSFEINGKDHGKAYENVEEFKNGDIYAAVCCHKSGGSLEIIEAKVWSYSTS